MTDFSENIMQLRYSWDVGNRKETWEEIASRVVNSVFSNIPKSLVPQSHTDQLIEYIKQRKFIPGGRFLAQAGRDYHQTSNCFLLRAEDTREGWGDLMYKATVMLMSGGGLGIDYSQLRPNGTPLKRSGGTSSGALPLMRTINEIGRGVMSGGKRRSAIYGSLRWNHGDILDFIRIKDWPEYIRKEKETNFDAPAPMDMTNISVILDRDFFYAFDNPEHSQHGLAREVYDLVTKKMCKTGEPGFQIDYDNSNESLRNACTEIVSEDDSDVCVLGSINFANIENLEELKNITELGTLFLLIGTEYTDVPTDKVRKVQQKNRRLGLGIMGLHEWLIKRNKKYGRDDELKSWLLTWEIASSESACKWSSILEYNCPIAVRSIAPNGTISIVGGKTTSGIEPIFAVAYERKFLSPTGWKKQYVIDPVAERLIQQGFDPNKIEDAYSLSLDIERRIDFQSFVQEFVDNAISSTLNLPAYGTFGNEDYQEFGKKLYSYLPNLRGITCYPDGARGGQPLTVVDYSFAHKHKNIVYEANEDCAGGVCGI